MKNLHRSLLAFAGFALVMLALGCSVINPICLGGCQNNSNNQNQNCVTCPSMGKASTTVYKP